MCGPSQFLISGAPGTPGISALLVWEVEGRGQEHGLRVVVCFLPSGHADNNVGRTSELVQVRQGTRTGQHEVRSRAERRRGAPHRPPRRSPQPAAAAARPAPEEGDPAGWGQAVPGDFTLFEARVFCDRRCHSGGFSFLLHWHLPPSPARWTGRPGRRVALRRSAGSRLPGTAAQARGATPRRRRRALGLLLGAARGRQRSARPHRCSGSPGQGTPTARHLRQSPGAGGSARPGSGWLGRK